MSPIDTQKKVFAEQLMLAQENDLPVILHIRDAYEDAYDILKTVGIPEKGVLSTHLAAMKIGQRSS